MFWPRKKKLSQYEEMLALCGKDQRADLQDVFYCFRLLLGRDPSSEEISGHINVGVGKDLGTVVKSYIGSLEFANRKLLQVDSSQMPKLANYNGLEIFVDSADPNIGPAIVSGSYEADVMRVFEQHLKDGATVVDIGANVGLYSLVAARAVGPRGMVFAIEPNPANAKMIKMSALKNGFENIVIIAAGASDEYGLLRLNLSYSNGTTSKDIDGIEQVFSSNVVPSVRLDDVLKTRVDLVKIDVEGAEYLALKGMSQTLEKHKPVILSEFSPNAMPGISGVTGEAYLEFLRGHGYSISVIGHGFDIDKNMSSQQVLEAHKAANVDHIDIVAF